MSGALAPDASFAAVGHKSSVSPSFSPVLAAAAVTPGQRSLLPAPSLAAALGLATPDAAPNSRPAAEHAGESTHHAASRATPEPVPAQSPVAAASVQGRPLTGQPDAADAAADALPAGFSPVQAAETTPLPHFVPAPSIAETVNGRNDTVQAPGGGLETAFSPVEAASEIPAQRFVPAPSLAAMAGLSTPDPWRSGHPAAAAAGDCGAAAMMSPVRSALADTERSVRARVQVRGQVSRLGVRAFSCMQGSVKHIHNGAASLELQLQTVRRHPTLQSIQT